MKMRIDYSALSLYRSCPRKFWFRYVRGFDTATRSDALAFGTAIHAALDIWHTGGSREEALEKFSTVAVATALSEIQEEERRSIEHGRKLLSAYFKNYRENPYESFTPLTINGAPSTELHLMHPLTDWLTYNGRVDMIGRKTADGRIALVEHKTAYRLDKNFYDRVKPNDQITGYIWLARKALKIDVDEAIINALQTVTAKLEKTPSACFARIPTRRSQWEIDEWSEEIIGTCEDIRHDYESGRWKTGAKPDCCTAWNSPCVFMDVCNAKGDLRENLLQSNFVLNPWESFKIEP